MKKMTKYDDMSWEKIVELATEVFNGSINVAFYTKQQLIDKLVNNDKWLEEEAKRKMFK